MPYVSVEHEPDMWVDAHVEKQWKRGGKWRLSVYYFVGDRQYYRTFEADQVRPAMSAEDQGDAQGEAAAGQDRPEAEHHPRTPIDLRDPQHLRRRD
jgi:hypothetical protein